MQNPAIVREMGQTSRQHAERFSWGQTTKQLRGYYRLVLQNYPKPVDAVMPDDATFSLFPDPAECEAE